MKDKRTKVYIEEEKLFMKERVLGIKENNARIKEAKTVIEIAKETIGVLEKESIYHQLMIGLTKENLKKIRSEK